MRYVLILSLILWTAAVGAAQQSLSAYEKVIDQQDRRQDLIDKLTALQSPVEQNLFPPELVMRHRAELDLADTQRSALIAVIQEFQSGIVAVEWELQDAKLELEKQLAMYPTPQKAVEQALDSVLVHEAQIKKNHILMLVKVKNVLTQAQIDILTKKSGYGFGRGFGVEWK